MNPEFGSIDKVNTEELVSESRYVNLGLPESWMSVSFGKNAELCTFAEVYLETAMGRRSEGSAQIRNLSEKPGNLRSVVVAGMSVPIKSIGLGVITKNWLNVEQQRGTNYFGKEAALVVSVENPEYSEMLGWWMLRNGVNLVPDRIFWNKDTDVETATGKFIKSTSKRIGPVLEFLEDNGFDNSKIDFLRSKVEERACKSRVIADQIEAEMESDPAESSVLQKRQMILMEGYQKSFEIVRNLTLLERSRFFGGVELEKYVSDLRNAVANNALTNNQGILEDQRRIRKQLFSEAMVNWRGGMLVNFPDLMRNAFASYAMLNPEECVANLEAMLN